MPGSPAARGHQRRTRFDIPLYEGDKRRNHGTIPDPRHAPGVCGLVSRLEPGVAQEQRERLAGEARWAMAEGPSDPLFRVTRDERLV